MALRFISRSGTRLRSVSHSVLRELADSLFAVAFPTSCLLCQRELTEANWSGVCPDCWESLRPWAGAACSRCGLPIASDQVTQSGGEESGAAGSDVLCGQCRTGGYEFDLARSYGVYAGALRAAILLLKFHRRERLGRRLGEALSRTCSKIENNMEPRGHEPPLLVPVPLHPSRERERGFNQAELLAQGLGDVTVLGSSHSSDTVRIKEFFTRNGHPYTYIDLERDADVERLLFDLAGE